ncbi:hypothetical protein JX265_013806 [Neoarthrinium moseri]|uniref:Uncharacterized protein n=1 Tax=Neoarthrinium moseri TaxID=1658444 RepID=A0A9Q0AIC8_9PEZI|nr:hypothetical protein JX265_013806 [Neoarthrinium moseri]
MSGVLLTCLYLARFGPHPTQSIIDFLPGPMWTAAIVADFLSGACQVVARWIRCQRADFPPGGSGAHAPARHCTAPGLPSHTIYAPSTIRPGEKLPLLVWANGGGLAWGLTFADFLREVASHGYIIVANGSPRGWGTVDERGQLSAVQWAAQEPADELDIRRHLDLERIALAGQSKGGVHTYKAATALRQDPRVKTVALFNSGMMRPRKQDLDMVAGLAIPVYYFVGDERDVLYKNAAHDWELLPQNLPAYFASLDVGHLGTFYEPGGGLFADAAVKWLHAELMGDEESKKLLISPEGPWRIRLRNL